MVDYEVKDREGDRAFLVLRGELVGDVSSRQIEHSLERHFVDDGVKVIDVDVGELETITLEGVGILLELWMSSRSRGKRFEVLGASGQVLEKLRTTGVADLLGPG
jgi:hypothetical protein